MKRFSLLARCVRRAFSTTKYQGSIKEYCADLAERDLIAGSHPSNLSAGAFACTSNIPDVVYAGFDPTASSLHVGHLIILTGLFRAALHGCKVIALVGQATAHIGDPSGHQTDREIIESEQITENTEVIKAQISRIYNNFTRMLGVSKKPLILLDNMDWHGQMSSLEFMKICRDFRVGSMLHLGSVKSRIRDGSGLSCSELLYQIFQAYDWYRLALDYNCYMQIGGNDQLGHLDAGYDYLRKLTAKSSVGVCLPLLTDAHGKKITKSSGGTQMVWLDGKLTSPYAFYQFFHQKSDLDIISLYRYLSLDSVPSTREVLQEHDANRGKWLAQHSLAEQMTELVHGVTGLQTAQKCTAALFHGSLDNLQELPLNTVMEQFGEASIQRLKRAQFSTLGQLADVLRKDQNKGSQLMKSGALKLNGVRFTDPDELIDYEKICLPGKPVTLVCWGKRRYHLVVWG